MAANFDAQFAQIAQQAGGIQPLLDSFMGFLHRSTDFYVVYNDKLKEKATMGFPPGEAENLLLESFKRFPFKQYTPHPIPEPISAPVKRTSKSTETTIQPVITEEGKQIPIANGGIGVRDFI